MMYQTGWGVAKDYQEAAKWARKAADQGNAKAQFNIALMSDKGREYFAEGANPNGTTYNGKVFIVPEGDSYKFTWKIAGETYFGNGVMSVSALYIKWGTSPDKLDSLVTYSMGENGVLKGVWGGGKGTETLIPK